MRQPKILIINQPFNNDTGGGITLTNLFSGWDRDKLAVACSGYLLGENINMRICNTYYQLGHKERKWIFPLNYFKRKYYSGLITFDDLKIQNLSNFKSTFRVKLIMNYIYPFLDYVGLFPFIFKTGLSKDFCNWLDEFNPEVVYAQAHSREDLLFCLILNSYLKKPLIFHMMDDWQSKVKERGLFKNFWYKKIDHEFRELLNQAAILMSISDCMANEYKLRYNKDFITFHNPINILFWKKYRRSNYKLSNNLKFLYAGRIGEGIDSSLKTIAKAIERINKEINISAEFILQTKQKPSWTNKYKHLKHNNLVNYDDLPKVFAEADFLVLPYDFSRESLSFIKYSMPTKASEYMASGTPIIVFAPKGTAIVDYAEGSTWAKVVTENNLNLLYTEIRYLIENQHERERLTQNAIQTAEKNHNSIEVKSRFKHLIYSLINPTSKINFQKDLLPKIYFYPKINYKIASSPNPYINDFENHLSAHNVIVNQHYNKIGVLEFFKYLFRTDIFLLNWIENLIFKRYGRLQIVAFCLFIIAAKCMKKKTVWILHNKYSHGHEKNPWIDFIFILLIKYSDLIITHSTSGADFVKDKSPADYKKVKYFIHPVREVFPLLLNGGECKYDFMIWGSIYPYKGVLEFLMFLNKSSSDLKILIVGKCSDQKYKQALESNLSKYVTFYDEFFELKEIAKYASQTKFILFTYRLVSLLSSGSLMDSVRMRSIIVGPHVGAFKDLSMYSFVRTYVTFEDIISIYQEYRPNSEVLKKDTEEFCRNNAWPTIIKCIQKELIAIK